MTDFLYYFMYGLVATALLIFSAAVIFFCYHYPIGLFFVSPLIGFTAYGAYRYVREKYLP